MGLFSRKKKPSAAEIAAAQQAEQQRQAQAAADAKAKKEAADRAEREKVRAREDKTLNDITAKRKDIDQLERAVVTFEQDRKKEATLAIKAKREKRVNQASIHLRNAKRLETKIKQYQVRISQNQSQLDALEDAHFNLDGANAIKTFNQNMEGLKQDVGEVDQQLQDMRETMDDVTAVNQALEGDVNLYGSAVDNEDELAALEAEFADQLGDTTAADIPAVPGTVPTMPPPQASAAADEDEEIRKLEAGVGL
eukprot:GFKZ01011436.1.p1 GENE.GFKZ01011436.1~~GFKZ01011436.1.p1  ORF type:complete len:252 (+),score=72.31 GFKZ01011436.1:440-1195(+)